MSKDDQKKQKAIQKALKKSRKKKPDGPILSPAQIQILMIMSLVVGGIFMPTTILLLFGMLPTIVAFIVQKKENRIRALTIGAMNLAGCVPFLLELWLEGHSFNNSFGLLADPRTIIIIYVCAGIGYVIDWAMTEFVSSLLYERGQKRKDEMKKRQEELVGRWGEKVTGRYELDEDGFPIDVSDEAETSN